MGISGRPMREGPLEESREKHHLLMLACFSVCGVCVCVRGITHAPAHQRLCNSYHGFDTYNKWILPSVHFSQNFNTSIAFVVEEEEIKPN